MVGTGETKYVALEAAQLPGPARRRIARSRTERGRQVLSARYRVTTAENLSTRRPTGGGRGQLYLRIARGRCPARTRFATRAVLPAHSAAGVAPPGLIRRPGPCCPRMARVIIPQMRRSPGWGHSARAAW
jgi:hypothetical protein